MVTARVRCPVVLAAEGEGDGDVEGRSNPPREERVQVRRSGKGEVGL